MKCRGIRRAGENRRGEMGAHRAREQHQVGAVRTIVSSPMALLHTALAHFIGIGVMASPSAPLPSTLLVPMGRGRSRTMADSPVVFSLIVEFADPDRCCIDGEFAGAIVRGRRCDRPSQRSRRRRYRLAKMPAPVLPVETLSRTVALIEPVVVMPKKTMPSSNCFRPGRGRA